MKIETKFDIGQEVYYLADNKVVSSKIISISIQVTSMGGQPKNKISLPRAHKGQWQDFRHQARIIR